MLRLQWVSIPLDGCMWEMREDVKRSIQSPFWMHSTTSFSRKPSSPFLFFSLSFHHLFWLFGSQRNDYKGKGGCYFREKAKILFGQIIHFCVTNFCLISGMLQLSRSILSRTWPDPFSEYSFNVFIACLGQDWHCRYQVVDFLCEYDFEPSIRVSYPLFLIVGLFHRVLSICIFESLFYPPTHLHSHINHLLLTFDILTILR